MKIFYIYWYLFCFCPCLLQHGASGFSHFSSSSSALWHITIPMPYFKGNFSHTDARFWFIHSFKVMPSHIHKKPFSDHLVVLAACHKKKNFTYAHVHTFLVVWTVIGTQRFQGFSSNVDASCGACMCFSSGGTGKALNISKSLCGGSLTQKNWESLNLKWVNTCLLFFLSFYVLEGVGGL